MATTVIPQIKLGSQGLQVIFLFISLIPISFEISGVDDFDDHRISIVALIKVSKVGYGCMGLTGVYNNPLPQEEGISIIKYALEKGITFFDTADVYGVTTNEILVGKALKQLPRDKIQLATKFGIVTTADGKIDAKGSPEYVRKCCEESLKRLDVEYIDLYYQHRIDTSIPIEETIGELKKLVEEGKIKYIGLSEASVDTIRRAHVVHPITAVQLEWSLWTRDIEEDIIPVCRSFTTSEHVLFVFIT
ncbi:hypothetical protein KI387_030466 [Taxus chinensis]|uniref:NADP-dependent oxidoreductase domain-containing protein n=1 Tax=Taxus chinensis TaxID=29808 RepID=A0AA38CLT1_TAXCH|nr:hypothetical protein KI387_030466 [Taxus chinensis]